MERIVYGDFADILKPDSNWAQAGFPTPDGFWEFREPNALVLVQNGRLRVAAVPLARSHDGVQILDNAKHMYFSRERFEVPDQGEISVETEIRAQIVNGVPEDLYDGFVSLNLLDFSTGLALDFFVCNEKFATVYARLPFPGTAIEAGAADKPNVFAIFKELPLPGGAQQTHRYKITYSKADAVVSWYVNDELVNQESGVPVKMDGFVCALGLMTEKEIHDGKSVSLHGQGIAGEWAPLVITKD
ncbi:MAG: DUF6081 family protein [Dehalococcoidia bacterium]|nr:DUF6081 family protein [Dehalococcoidia bacterium]